MPTNSPTPSTDFIDSIVNVTAYKDRELLEEALAETLYKLTKVDIISISHIAYHYGQPEIHPVFSINPSNIEKEGFLCPDKVTPLEEMPHFKECYDSAAANISFPDSDSEKTHILHPLINLHDKVVGFLELYGPPLAPQNEHLLFGMLQIYRNYLRLLEESEVDTLTGLLNRRTFDRNLDQLVTKANEEATNANKNDQREHRSAVEPEQSWLAVLDIDHFKKINDNYGHLYGDEVLILLANLMRKSFRSSDKLFRFGGEEFVIVLKCTDRKGADLALSRFRSVVEQHIFPQVGNVTVSMGYIEIKPGDLPTQVLGKADEALYYAKNNGRNQVHSYEELVDKGEIVVAAAKASDDIELF